MDKTNEWLSSFQYTDRGQYIVRPEFLVSQVGRRADFLMISPSGRLINVEAKCNDFSTMLKQLDDHALYCNYSFAYIPDYSLTPEWFKKSLIKRRYGLIVYNKTHKTVTEVLEAHQNLKINKRLRSDVIRMIKAAIEREKHKIQIEKINNSQQQFNF